MDDISLIIKARDMLKDITPLKTNCGLTCSAACCESPDDDEETLGMSLFPGEETLYRKKFSWYQVHKGPSENILTCEGRCPRDDRPLACRIFPLTPYEKNGKLYIKMDKRASTMCPLYASGKRGLQPIFVDTVREAMELLWQSEKIREHIYMISRQIDEFDIL